jgi:GT2 family glycosyltransferase
MVSRPTRVRDVFGQVRSLAPATHVLFLGDRDTPAPDFLATVDEAVFENFSEDVLYGDKTREHKKALWQERLRLPAWSPHRIEHENFVGESFVVRIPFLLSVESQFEPDAIWDSWALLRAAKARSANILKVDQAWFISTGVATKPHVRERTAPDAPFTATDCSLITLTAGARDSLRSFPTLVEEHLSAIASSDAAGAEHIIVVGPECPEHLRKTLGENPSSKLRLVEVPERFNFAHRCNVARTMSSGAITVLINDDFVPRRPDWLEKLLEPFADPRVGITGTTMLYADDTIQHIGVGIKDGSFQHFYVGADLSEPRVAQLIRMNREVDAVTGACLAIRTQLFDDVGGLAEGFPLNFNDVDLCLKVRALGHTIVMVGEPLGYHLESRTRPAVSLPEESLLFFARWPSSSITSDFSFENLA